MADININLLPWREKRRAQQKREFMISLGIAAAIGAVIAGSIFTYYSMQVSGQKDRNAYLEDKISLAEGRIKAIKDLDTEKQRLLGRKEIIESLQNERARVVHLFEALSKTAPEGVVLTLVKQNSDGMLIEGRAQSNNQVSNYMRELESSGWMKDPNLSVIEASRPDPGFEAFPYIFKLSVGLVRVETIDTGALEAIEQVEPMEQTETMDVPDNANGTEENDQVDEMASVEGSAAAEEAAEGSPPGLYAPAPVNQDETIETQQEGGATEAPPPGETGDEQ